MISNKLRPLSSFIICLLLIAACKKDPKDTNNGTNPPNDNEQIGNYIYTERYQDTNRTSGGFVSYVNIKVLDKNYNKLWEKRLSSFYSTILMLRKGTLYIASDKSLYATDLKTGAFKWSNENTFGYFAQLAERNDTLFYVHADTYSTVAATDALTGNQLWEFNLPDGYGYTGEGILDSNTFYFNSIPASGCSHINAFDISQKRMRWESPCTGTGGGLFSTDKGLYFLSNDYQQSASGKIISINKADGNLKWEVGNIEIPGATYKMNALNKNDLIILHNYDYDRSGQGGLKAVNAVTGAVTWTRFLDYSVMSSYLYDDKLYFTGFEKIQAGGFYLVCSELSTGNIIWKHLFTKGELSINTFTNLLVYNNTVYGDYTNNMANGNNDAIMSFNAGTGAVTDSAKIVSGNGPYSYSTSSLFIVNSSGELIRPNN